MSEKMQIIEGDFFECINPLAPICGALVRVTRITQIKFTKELTVSFICVGADPDYQDDMTVESDWVFTTSLSTFKNDFETIPPALKAKCVGGL